MRACILAAVCGIALVGCNSNKSASENVTPNELDQVIKADGNPNYEQLTAKLLAKQPKVEGLDYAKAIAEITPDPALDPWATKVEVDNRLAARNGGEPILYNRDFVSLDGPLTKGRMQCFSGSLLNLIVQRQKSQAEFEKNSPVMIFTAGHILPGFIKREGADHRLIGVETTVTGLGRTDFGLTKDLNRSIRVVDAESYVRMYLYQSKLKNVPAMVDILLKQTADRYAIPLARTEARIARGEMTIAADAPMNRSAFSFGGPQDLSEAGDKVRTHMDEIVPSEEYSNRAVVSGEALSAPIELRAETARSDRSEQAEVHPLELKLFPNAPRLLNLCGRDAELSKRKKAYLDQVAYLLADLRSSNPAMAVTSPEAYLNYLGERLGLGGAACVVSQDRLTHCRLGREQGREEARSAAPRLTHFYVILQGREVVSFWAADDSSEDANGDTRFIMVQKQLMPTTMTIYLGSEGVSWQKDGMTFVSRTKAGDYRESHSEPSMCAAPISSEKMTDGKGT